MKSVYFHFLFAFRGLHHKEDIQAKLPCKLAQNSSTRNFVKPKALSSSNPVV